VSSPAPAGTTHVGLAPHVAGTFCYAPCGIGLVFSLLALRVEKQNRFLRLHAFQSLSLHALLLGLWVVLRTVGYGLKAARLGFLIGPLQVLLAAAAVAVTVILMLKAYRHEEFALPVLRRRLRRWASPETETERAALPEPPETPAS